MRIGFIGVGLMGKPMVIKLAEHGYEVSIYNRTKSKLQDIQVNNVFIEETIADVVNNSQIVITMLTDYNSIEDVLTDEILDLMKGKTLMQMSTISPEETLMLNDKLIESNIRLIEAPVLGSIPQIESKTLISICSCEKEDFVEVSKILKCFGDKIYYAGKIGSASTLKLALNQLIISLNTSFGLSLGYVMNNNADVDMFMDILRSSALYSPTFEKKYEKMKNYDFSNPNFPLKHMLKDVNLIKESFESSKISIEQIDAIKKYLATAVENGLEDADYSAVYSSINPKQK